MCAAVGAGCSSVSSFAGHAAADCIPMGRSFPPPSLVLQAPGPLPDPFAQQPPSAAAPASPTELGDGGFMADGGEGEAPPPRRRPPKIFYATRTHSQIQQARCTQGCLVGMLLSAQLRLPGMTFASDMYSLVHAGPMLHLLRCCLLPVCRSAARWQTTLPAGGEGAEAQPVPAAHGGAGACWVAVGCWRAYLLCCNCRLRMLLERALGAWRRAAH